MKKKTTLVVGSLIVLTLAYFAVYGLRTTRPESLRRLIAQNVKVGSSPDDVIRFLDSQHLEHSSLLRLSEFETLRRTYGNTPLILARKRRTLQAWWGSESIQIIFVFDESNRLLKFDLHPEYTAL
jgi:hypothetical protein